MNHSVTFKYRIKYVWIGIAVMIGGGVILFNLLRYYGIDFGLLEIITYIAGTTATLSLIYHAFNLEHQINTQLRNNDLFRAKYTYDIISEWSKPSMKCCISDTRKLLTDPDRKKELENPSNIADFAKYLALEHNTEKRSNLVLILNYFENICTMIETDHIDRNIVKKAFKSLFVSHYRVLKHYIDFRQKEYPDSWMYFEKTSKRWLEETRNS